LKHDEENFDKADKAYIGTIQIFWKKCVDEASGGGEPPSIPYKYELCDPEGECTKEISGAMSGECRWVPFGHPDSKFTASGARRDGDSQGGAGGKKPPAGQLGLIPKAYTHPSALNAKTKYVVHYKLSKRTGSGSLAGKSVVGEAESTPTPIDRAQPEVAQWAQDMSKLPVYDTKDDCLLEITVMTSGVGTTPG